MRKIWMGSSVSSMRKNPEEGEIKGGRRGKVLKRFTVQLIVTTFLVSSIGFVSPLFSEEQAKEDFDLETLLADFDLPEMAPYLASSSVLSGGASGDKFGFSVANAGDFNGDGKDDVIVGAPYACSSPNDKKGKAYIFLGGSAGDGSPTSADVVLVGEAVHANFGHSVAGGGDFNSDNKDDVVVGAPDYTESPATYKGRAYVFEGTSSLGPPWPKTISASSADHIFTGLGTHDYLGWSVAIDGNFDDLLGDDIIIGAPGYDSSHVQNVFQGRVYMVLSTTGTVGFDATFTGESSKDSWFGKSISYVGDVGNGAKDDMIVGAPEYPNDGKAYIFYGEASPSGDTPADHMGVTKITGETAGDEFGISVSHAGDVNGDSKDDVVVGDPGYDDGTKSNAGRAYIFQGTISHGSTILASNADKKLTGESAGAKLGISVSSAGDYNKDTYDDVIVGAYLEDSLTASGTDVGKAHIFYGGSSMDEKVDITMAGDTSSSNRYKLGYAVSNAGDFDNDGYDDVIVGAPEASSAKGYAHLYNFHDYFTNTGTVDPATSIGEERGYSVASGDINSDGYSDIIVGAPRYSSGFSVLQKGKVYVFKGSSTGPVSSPLLMELTGEGTGDRFGTSVASGNFNGDMFDDVLVGAPGYDSGTGRAYIFHGSSTPNSVADVTLDGENNWDNFGIAVAAAETHTSPMVSYDDAIVGAPFYDDGLDTDIGKVYVFHGSHSMDSSADYTKLGEDAGDVFGRSVSNAGDVNGAAEDVIVGAPLADAPSKTDCGKAYIYTGSLIGLWGPPIATLAGESGGDWFGYSVSTAGDYNGNGYDDVIVGAIQYAFGLHGKAYIYYGGSGTFNTIADFTFTGEGDYDAFGNSVSTAGDVNNDGYDDVVVGAEYNDAGGSNAGRVYIYYGASSGSAAGREDIYMTGQPLETLGSSVACAGDVNNDNYDDIVTGARFTDLGKGSVKVWGDPS